MIAFLKRAWPYAVGIAILAVVATRVPYDSFRSGVDGPYLALAGVNVALVLLVLGADAVATWIGLIAIGMRRPFKAMIAIRGTIFLLFLVNYAVGQGGFGYYLHRTGAPALRAVGATLFLIGSGLATLLVITTTVWAVADVAPAHATLWWGFVGGSIAFAIYLAVIAVSPGFLARRDMLAPLFDAGIRGHAIAMLGRVPQVLVTMLGHWCALRVWGFDVPIATALTLIPALAIISVLPITVGGLGTTQAAFVYFFSDYAPGATADDRQAAMLAFAIIHFMFGVVASVVVGLASVPFARRAGAFAKREP